MPLPTFNPPVGPSPGTSHKPTVSLWEAEFGDGYSQPTPKGINHIRKSTTLSWKTLTYDQMQEIKGFFERQQGNKVFYYRPFGEQFAVKWTCKEWSSVTEGGIWQVDATLVQSFSNEK
ncbi:phage tail protein [Ensifer sp. ENS10]|uniref:phage tail protein n=1 Tax=Ensifer sp. ENS10 TaxID=2769286 RepID=UPI00177BBBFC|nr:phage tail protein [Ensifer sp. ENS10]MBD9511637.1 phage tail protein [Ensifer sp. ENS10]